LKDAKITAEQVVIRISDFGIFSDFGLWVSEFRRSGVSRRSGTVCASCWPMFKRRPKIETVAAQAGRGGMHFMAVTCPCASSGLPAWCWVFVASSAILAGSPDARGQETASRTRVERTPTLLAYAEPTASPAFARASLTSGAGAQPVVRPASFDAAQHETALSTARSLFQPGLSENNHQVQSYLREMSQSRLRPNTDMALEILQKKVPSRFAYNSWTGVGAGFGQFMQEDALGRSRTSGAGVQDPHWVYLKMNFRF
jgi:hypothetical protein